MLARIVVIQFRKNQQAIQQEKACLVREAGIYTDIDFLDALDDSINWKNPADFMKSYQGVILGGSGDFDFDGNRNVDDTSRQMSYMFLDRLQPLFRYIFDTDTPTLGICYGHQLLGAFAGAQVFSDETQKKTKSHEVKLMVDKNNYFLFSDLPESFFAHYGHKDVLDRVPSGAVLLMNGGEQCKVSALRYQKNIYSTQFHPELTYDDMINRMKHSPGYLPEGVIAEEVFSKDPNSNRILRNFSKLVAQNCLEFGLNIETKSNQEKQNVLS